MSRLSMGVFGSGALFNLLAGVPFLLLPQRMTELLGAEGSPLASLFMQLTGCSVVLFGVLYALIASDIRRFRPLILLGVAGKLTVVVLVWYAWFSAVLGWFLPLLVLADALYSLLFVHVYWATAESGCAGS